MEPEVTEGHLLRESSEVSRNEDTAKIKHAWICFNLEWTVVTTDGM